MWEVLVANVGRVFEGKERAARACFNDYVAISKSEYGRASGKSVMLFRDGEIAREYVGRVQRDEMK